MSETNWSPFRFVGDDTLLDIHRRSLLDAGWLQSMIEHTKEGSAPQKHYKEQLIKEEKYLTDVEEELERRGL